MLDILKITGIIILISLIIYGIIIGIIWCIQNLGYDYEEYWSTGIVTQLQYKEAWVEEYWTTETYTSGNETKTKRVKKTKNHPEEHNIWVTYKDKSTKFNNKNIFWSLTEGQEIPVCVYDGYNKEGELKHTYFKL